MTKATSIQRIIGNDLDTIVKTLCEVHGLIAVGSALARQYGRTPTMQAVLSYPVKVVDTAPPKRSPHRTRVVIAATKSRQSMSDRLCAFGCTCIGIAIITVLGALMAGLIASSPALKDFISYVALAGTALGAFGAASATLSNLDR